jgi:hypothetical protein
MFMDSSIGMLRHTLATLAYRAGKTLRDAPPEFADFRAESVLGVAPARTPVEILAHMGDLLDWAFFLVEGRHEWHNSKALPWGDEVARFFRCLTALDQKLAESKPQVFSAEKLFQGPIADALTHTGQLAMLRRMAGCPVRGENYFTAEISCGRVGVEQPPSRVEFA